MGVESGRMTCQRLHQVRPVNHANEILPALLSIEFDGVRPNQNAMAVPAPHFGLNERQRYPAHRIADAECVECPHGIGPEADPRADFAPFRRAFVNRGVDANPFKRDGSGQPGDSRADNNDAP